MDAIVRPGFPARPLWSAALFLLLLSALALCPGGCATLGLDQESRLTSLEEEAAEIQARIEKLEMDAGEAQSRLAEIEAELLVLRGAQQARSVSQGSAPPPASPPPASSPPASPPPASPPPVAEEAHAAMAEMPPEPSEPAESPPPAAAPPVENPPVETPPPATSPPAAVSPPPASPPQNLPPMQQLYDRALELCRAGRTAEARPLFQQFLEHYQGSSLTPNAMYWLGETYYHEQDFAQAILTFKDVPRLYPDHPKAAAAMLKTGYSYARMGDVQNARFYLQTLLEEYPDSEPAALARQKLATLQ